MANARPLRRCDVQALDADQQAEILNLVKPQRNQEKRRPMTAGAGGQNCDGGADVDKQHKTIHRHVQQSNDPMDTLQTMEWVAEYSQRLGEPKSRRHARAQNHLADQHFFLVTDNRAIYRHVRQFGE
ncbi:hypothetical protein L0F63_006175 [Massospora cicadina]|nr:hypothetical protein L0F63_006175 [Massospora cicadina]